jgi:hypothetical protein
MKLTLPAMPPAPGLTHATYTPLRFWEITLTDPPERISKIPKSGDSP